MRSPAWMAAYTLALLLVGATYAALVFYGSGAALLFALAALAAVVVSVMLVVKK